MRRRIQRLWKWVQSWKRQEESEEVKEQARTWERHPDRLKKPEYVEMIRTQVYPTDIVQLARQMERELANQDANAAQIRELQRHLDERKSAHYEPPEKHTDRISQAEIERAIYKVHLRRIETYEMQATFPVADTDKFLI